MTNDEPERPSSPSPSSSSASSPSSSSTPDPASESPESAPAAAARRFGDPQTEVVRLKEHIYATITMIAVVVALAEDDAIKLQDAMWSIIGTAVGVWLATLVADQQAHRVVHHRVARGEELRVMLYTSAAVLLSAVGPLVFTGLSALGVLSLHVALLTAVGVELAGLFGWGMLGGLRLGGGLIAASVAGAADLLIGIVIVSVKVAAGH